jgi:hypothetical protein
MAETAEVILNGQPTEIPGEPQETPAPETLAAEPTTESAPQEGEQATEPSWLDRMETRFSELRTDLGIEEPPEQAPQQQQQQQQVQTTQPEPEPDDLSEFGDPEVDPDAQAQIQAYLDRKAEEAADRRLAPFFEQENTRRRVEAAMALEEQYPELRESRVAQPIVQMAHGLLHELANDAQVPGLAEKLAGHPSSVKLVKLIYMASKAEAAASSETPAGSTQEITLETPGARPPSGQPEGPTEAQSFVQAGGTPLFG